MRIMTMHALQLSSSLILGVCLSAMPVLGQTKEQVDKAKTKSDQMSDKAAQTDLGKGSVFAEATLAPKSGSKVGGTVVFTKTKKGLHVMASITGAKPGRSGFHIHEKGDCSAADASSAGGHFNPTHAEHGGPDAHARHVGDLGNITIREDGTGLLNMDLPEVKNFSDWNAIIGKSVVLHENTDDLKSQPAGNAGPRIACGVIEAAAGKKAEN